MTYSFKTWTALGEDYSNLQIGWKSRSLVGTSLWSSLYYDDIKWKDLQYLKSISILKRYFFFREVNKREFKSISMKRRPADPDNLFERTTILLHGLIYFLFNNSLEIPDIRFSTYNDGIDIKVSGSFYKFLITVYDDVYALAYRDKLKNSQNKQNSNINSILNTIIGIYNDDVVKNDINQVIEDYFYKEIQNGWS